MKAKYSSPVEAARDLIKKHGITDIPVDIESLCRDEGIKIIYTDFTKLEESVGKKISGLIQNNSKYGYVILVNENDIKSRARFTIAHELGHYFLHMKGSEKKVITSFRADHSPKERQADRFAAELLMPEDLIREEYSRLFIPVSDSLADTFGVSKQAMRYRLDELELMYV